MQLCTVLAAALPHLIKEGSMSVYVCVDHMIIYPLLHINVAASTLYPTTVSVTNIMLLCNSACLTIMLSAGGQSSVSSTYIKIKEKGPAHNRCLNRISH